MSDIISEAFDIRIDSDYNDYFVVSRKEFEKYPTFYYTLYIAKSLIYMMQFHMVHVKKIFKDVCFRRIMN